MHNSILDGIDFSELRKWCLSSLWQHPHLIPGVDGTLFISEGVAYPIFKSMREVFFATGDVTLPAVFEASGFDWNVAYGLAVLPEHYMDEFMAKSYLDKLAERTAAEGRRNAA